MALLTLGLGSAEVQGLVWKGAVETPEGDPIDGVLVSAQAGGETLEGVDDRTNRRGRFRLRIPESVSGGFVLHLEKEGFVPSSVEIDVTEKERARPTYVLERALADRSSSPRVSSSSPEMDGSDPETSAPGGPAPTGGEVQGAADSPSVASGEGTLEELRDAAVRSWEADDWKDALEKSFAAVERDPEQAWPWFYIGVVHFRGDDREEAREALSNFVRLASTRSGIASARIEEAREMLAFLAD